MSDDQVKRYQLDYHHTQTYAEMVEDCDGDWVKYKDYKDAADHIEELELAVRYEADLAQMALDARKELETKLTKALEFIEDLTGCEWPYSEDAKRILAELSSVSCANTKGQDDE
jgi:hypothetical protein